MNPATAARSLVVLPARLEALQAKQARAQDLLTALLGDQGEVRIPGYLVIRTPDGLTVKPVTLPEGWAQLKIEETA